MNITAIQTFLQGKKTYFVAIVSVLYLLGVYLKFWPFSEDVVAALGIGGGSTLLAKIERQFEAWLATPSVAPTTSVTVQAPAAPVATVVDAPLASTAAKVTVLALLLGISALFFAGCGLTKSTLVNGGAYAPGSFQVTTNGELVSTNFVATAAPDLLFYQVDSAFNAAYTIVQTTFALEYYNRAVLWKLSPDIKHTLDSIRPAAWKAVVTYETARTAYEKSPTSAGLTGLQDLLANVQQFSTLATSISAQIQTVSTNSVNQ